MKLQEITNWLDETLNVAAFNDVSNNGIQLARTGDEDITKVAFAVDASLAAVKAADEEDAQILIVHHGFSWGGGIRRVTDGVYNVIKAAMDANIAIYACHLPLDAHPVLGNNAQIAKALRLTDIKPAFSYHGNVIGLTGRWTPDKEQENWMRVGGIIDLSEQMAEDLKDYLYETKGRVGDQSLRVGVCSGGAGEFAEEAKRLGCDVFLTGEANWGEVIAAHNVGMTMKRYGHLQTEIYGIRAIQCELAEKFNLDTVDLSGTIYEYLPE